MQISHPHLERAQNLFKRIYQNNRLNLDASRRSLEVQLNLYLDHIGAHINQAIKRRERDRIWSIIARNNQVAKILETPGYRSIVKAKKKLLGKTILGYVLCIDGRIPAIFLGGRFSRYFETPAAEITVIKRKSDGKLIPDSTDLNEALRIAATDENDLLEIVLAHTSLTNPHHGCGAMAGKRQAGILDKNLSNEEANLKLIKEQSIPALTNVYNEFREQLGFEPLKTVALAALYDTDTFGLIFNFDLKEKSLSTTDLTKEFSENLDDYFVKNNLVLGTFKEKFSDLKFLVHFSSNLLLITEHILAEKAVPELLYKIEEYIELNFPDLTSDQRQALKFVIVRNVALQFLIGSCNIKKSHLDHPFAEHGEGYMAVAMRGGTIGKFDPENQAFACSPSDPQSGIATINVMLSIMGDSPKIKPYILFVCNSVNGRDLKENNQIIQRLMGSNAGLLRDIIQDEKLGKMIESGEMILVPVLISEDTREVLRIIDHSAYI